MALGSHPTLLEVNAEFGVLIAPFMTLSECIVQSEQAFESLMDFANWSGGMVLIPHIQEVPSAGGAFSSLVDSILGAWTVEGVAPDWITIDVGVGDDGDLIEYTCDPIIDTSNSRDTRIKVVADSSSAVFALLSVIQLGIAPILSGAPLGFTPDAFSHVDLTSAITANGDWEHTVLDGSLWITVTSGSGTNNGDFIFNISDNSSGAERTARIKVYLVYNPDTYIAINVTQDFHELYITPDTIEVGQDETVVKTAAVMSSSAWEVKPGPVPAWITFIKDSGLPGESVEFSCSINAGEERDVTLSIILTGTTFAVALHIIQLGAYITITPDTLSVPVIGGEFALDVESSSDWAIENIGSIPSWITFTPPQGPPASNTLVFCQENPYDISRTYTASFALAYTPGVTNPVVITQLAAPSTIIIAPAYMTINAIGGTGYTTEITSNGLWAHIVATIPEWITVIDGSGGNGDSFKFSIDENPGDERAANIELYMLENPTVTAILSVVQEIHELTFNPPSISIPAVGVIEEEVIITSSEDWGQALAVGFPWITIINDSGASGEALIYTCDTNIAGTERIGEIEVTIIGSTTFREYFKITQAGATIDAVPSLHNVVNGGAAGLISVINSSSPWAVQSTIFPAWLTLNTDYGNPGEDLNFDVADNPDTGIRSVIIVVGVGPAVDAIVTTPVEIIQDGKASSIAINPTSSNVSYPAISISTVVTVVGAEEEWELDLATVPDWIKVTKGDGNTDEACIVELEANPSDSARNIGLAIVHSAYSNLRAIWAISQEASPCYITTNPTSIIIDSAGGEVQTLVLSSSSWAHVGLVPSWVTITQGEGESEEHLIVTVDTNMSIERSANINIHLVAHNEITAIFAITQEAYTS